MKGIVVLLFSVICAGCSHVVERDISVHPTVKSRAVLFDKPSTREQTLSVDGYHFQRAVLRFTIDGSSIAYVNDRLVAEGLLSLRTVRLLDFSFYTKTKVLSLPLGHTTWFASVTIELERRSDGGREVATADVQIEVPPAHAFLGPATTERGIDDELLGAAMSRFVAEKFRAAATELVSQQKKKPNPVGMRQRAYWPRDFARQASAQRRVVTQRRPATDRRACLTFNGERSAV